MAKLTGPLMSLDASGSVAGTLVFAKWKGRNYVRHLVKPSNPKTPGQTSFRAMMGFLSKNWAGIGSTDQASWHALAEQTKISDFNAYVKTNQARWTQALTPQVNVVAAPAAGPAIINTNVATGGVRQATIDLGWAFLLDNWGVVLYRNLVTGFSPAQTDVVAVQLADTGTSITIVDTPLEPNTYFWRFGTFDHQGQFSLMAAEITAVVT